MSKNVLSTLIMAATAAVSIGLTATPAAAQQWGDRGDRGGRWEHRNNGGGWQQGRHRVPDYSQQRRPACISPNGQPVYSQQTCQRIAYDMGRRQQGQGYRGYNNRGNSGGVQPRYQPGVGCVAGNRLIPERYCQRGGQLSRAEILVLGIAAGYLIGQ